MKSLERLILTLLRPLVHTSLEPLQFANQPRIGVKDAVILLLHQVCIHLDGSGSCMRIMFFDFSSAFNAIRPALLRSRLMRMRMDTPLMSWIIDYLTSRPQYVRLQNCISDTVVSSTGAPQQTVLSPFLFTLYTCSHFNYSSQSCHLQKFSNDSAIAGCINSSQENEHRGVVINFVEWCELNHL
ncbi:hypothetical protein LDENG_00064780 [Lucifuga dentata]|nr:hypothetical protein LDENG_00064780 [Lucifuga dentata]